MFACRDDDNAFPRHQACVYETDKGIQENGVILVKLGYMLTRRDFAPKYWRRPTGRGEGIVHRSRLPLAVLVAIHTSRYGALPAHFPATTPMFTRGRISSFSTKFSRSRSIQTRTVNLWVCIPQRFSPFLRRSGASLSAGPVFQTVPSSVSDGLIRSYTRPAVR